MQEITRWRALVGARVAVRYRLATPDPRSGATLTDVVGVLDAVLSSPDPGALRVRSRTGVVEVPLTAVVAGKAVPPRPSRPAAPHLAISITDLVTVMAQHWNPADSTRLGGWWLRAAGGFTNRANSVVPLGHAGVDDEQAERFTRHWYAERGLTATASIATTTPDGVPDDQGPARAAAILLAARGWSPVPDGSAVVLVGATGELRADPGLPEGLALDADERPDRAWLACARYRGRELPPQALPLLLSAPEQRFWSVRRGERTVAVARGTLADGWAGLTAVEVHPQFRRQGLARALLAAVAAWAWQRRAWSIYLQTAETNPAAQALYRSAGFVPHHRYDYLRAPVTGSASATDRR